MFLMTMCKQFQDKDVTFLKTKRLTDRIFSVFWYGEH